MKNNVLGRIALICIPWLILTGMVAGAYLPVYRGQKYLLPVKPRDPRDFFRGNYVDLQYEFSNLPLHDLETDLKPDGNYRFGNMLFLDLKKEDGKLQPVGLFESRARVKNVPLKVQPRWTLNKADERGDFIAGLESFFAPKTEAEAWETAMREGKVLAEVAIDPQGNARLVSLKKEK